MRFHTAVNKFCWQAVLGQPITVWRTAYHQKRPYLDLGDAVRAILFVVEKGIFNGEIYNVLTLNATVSDIVTAIRKNISELKIEFVDAEIMNQLSFHVSSDQFRRLGFESSGDLETGIGETIHLLRQSNHLCN
jgi:nucleoside-diphosphate-sugar epimerase